MTIPSTARWPCIAAKDSRRAITILNSKIWAGTPISGLSYTGGVTQQTFVYLDKMSSTPLEDGRSGTWALQAYVGSSFANASIKTQYNLIVNPAVTAKIGFHNPVRTLQAGLPLNPSGDINLSALNIEMQDFNGNPTPAASPLQTVQLATYRVASSSYDAYGFSVSTATLPPPPPAAPGFQISTTSVIINMNQWGTTFYYMDTNASENYTVPASSPALIAWVNNVNWSTGTQPVSITPNSIYRIGMLSAPSTLVAGTRPAKPSSLPRRIFTATRRRLPLEISAARPRPSN